MCQELYLYLGDRYYAPISQMRKVGLPKDLNLDLPQSRIVQFGSHKPQVAMEHLKWGWSRLRCEYVSDFKDLVPKKDL